MKEMGKDVVSVFAGEQKLIEFGQHGLVAQKKLHYRIFFDLFELDEALGAILLVEIQTIIISSLHDVISDIINTGLKDLIVLPPLRKLLRSNNFTLILYRSKCIRFSPRYLRIQLLTCPSQIQSTHLQVHILRLSI